LLKYMASGAIPRFPTNLRVFLLQQDLPFDLSLTVTEAGIYSYLSLPCITPSFLLFISTIVITSNAKKQQITKRLEELEGGDGSGEEVAQEMAELYEQLDTLDVGSDEARIASVSSYTLPGSLTSLNKAFKLCISLLHSPHFLYSCCWPCVT
jgi:hypothetical protein